jgi:uncharacterized delta-60 repeat protein
MRFHSDGTLDSGFGEGKGQILYSVPGMSMAALTLKLTADRILVAGSVTGGNQKLMAARFYPDGTPDPTFSATGFVSYDFFPDLGAHQNYEGLTSVGLDSGGRIIAAGYAYTWDADAFYANLFEVGRFFPNGNLDTTYGNTKVGFFEGMFHHDWGWPAPYHESKEGAMAMAVDNQDRAVIVGRGFVNDTTYHMAAARITNSGQFDLTFGSNGVSLVVFPFITSRATSILLWDGGTMVVGGQVDTSEPAFALARLTATGAHDNTFGSSGMVVTGFTGVHQQFGQAARDADLPDDEAHRRRGPNFLPIVAAVRSTEKGSIEEFVGKLTELCH